MNYALEYEKQEIQCPNCMKFIKTTYHDLYNHLELKCPSCKAISKFESHALSEFKHSIQNLEYAQQKFDKAFKVLFSTVKIISTK